MKENRSQSAKVSATWFCELVPIPQNQVAKNEKDLLTQIGGFGARFFNISRETDVAYLCSCSREYQVHFTPSDER